MRKIRWREMDKRKEKKIMIFFLISILMIVAITTTIYGPSKGPPDFEKLSDEKVLNYVKSGKAKTLDQQHLIRLGERLEKIPPEQRREAMRELTPEERENFRESRRKIAEARLQKTIDEFFSLPPEKQNEFLDRQIDEMGRRMQEFRQRFGERVGGFPQGFAGSPGEMSQDGEGLSAGGQERGGQGEAARQGRRNISPDARLQRMRNRLSETTPEERAKRREYFRRLRERMAERSRSR